MSTDPHPEDKVRTFPVLVVAALIVHDGKILLERRAPTGVVGLDFKWDLPGGKVECGEFPHDAIVREIQEELAVTVTPVALLPELKKSVWTYSDVTRHWIIAAYECRIQSGEPICGEYLQWFPVDELPDMLTADRELVELWKTGDK